MGTDDKTLARIMVARAEVDMLDVRKAFKAKYEESLHSFIEVRTRAPLIPTN